MIEITDVAADIIRNRSFYMQVRVQSWLDDVLLDDDVPIVSGSETVDRNDGVPEYGTLTVPLKHRGVSYAPIADEAVLGANGQRLVIEIGIGTGFGIMEWIQRGEFPIYRSEVNGDVVNVTFKGPLQKILEARLVSPFQPTGPFTNAFRLLLEPAMNVEFDPALADRSVIASTGNLDESRLDAMYSLLKSWPAKASTTVDGGLYIFVPPTTFTSVLDLTDGVGGTVITAVGSSTREGSYNAVVARGTDANGQTVQGVVYDLEGPKRLGGPFNELPVPYYFESSFIPTTPIAKAVARSMLNDIKRQTAKTYVVQAVPHPALQAGDVVSLTTDDYTELLCTVESMELPYVPGTNEPMTLIVREVTTTS